MRGPSRHHELFAASTCFSVVSSVGPAGHQPPLGWPGPGDQEVVVTVELMVERAAALDVGKDEVVACIRVPAAGGRGRRQEVRTFATFTASLEALAGWLQAEGVTQVVMEATGSYWKPIVRHEVPRVRAGVKGLRLRPVAAGR
jgi:hypothetical protein